MKLKGSHCDFSCQTLCIWIIWCPKKVLKLILKKVKTVKNLYFPQNTKEVRRFLGFTEYNRWFIKGYSRISQPQNDKLVGHNTKTSKAKGQQEIN